MNARGRGTCRLIPLVGCGMLLGMLLACGGAELLTEGTPRWACPSPTPRPWGSQGPIKGYQDGAPLPTTTPVGEVVYDQVPVYYQEWEQEYPTPGLAVYPSPTPYAMVGTSYVFGQRVEVAPLHVMVSARSTGPLVDDPTVPANTQQIHYVAITWYNHSGTSLAIDYPAQVQIRSVVTPDGATLADAGWGYSILAQTHDPAASVPPDSIPPGESHVMIPILAPIGEVQAVAISFAHQSSSMLDPTSAMMPPPNPELRDLETPDLTVFWSRGALRAGPGCADPGVLTPWLDGDGVSWGVDVPDGVPAPAGADRVVQVALSQVGRPYVWGAKGPDAFDCSGLMTWSYARIGISIPHGTSGQWPTLRPVSLGELLPGDLIFFAVASPGRIDHVGMLIGDVNEDGSWDMVHASAPCCGVRVEYSVLTSAFWRPKVMGFRTVR